MKGLYSACTDPIMLPGAAHTTQTSRKSFPTIMGNCVKCLMILMPNGVFIYLYSQSIRLNILRWGLHHPSGRCLGGSARERSPFWWLDSRHVKTNRVDQSGWMRDIHHVFHDVSCVSDLQATMFEHFLRNNQNRL